MLSLRLPGWLVLLIRLSTTAAFVYAGVVKATAPVGFAADVANYHLLPWTVGVGLAFYLPWLEIICGLALFLPRLARGAVLILLSLISIFIVASASAKLRGIDVTCGCFGGASRNFTFAGHLAIDVLLLTAIVVVFVVDRERVAT